MEGKASLPQQVSSNFRLVSFSIPTYLQIHNEIYTLQFNQNAYILEGKAIFDSKQYKFILGFDKMYGMLYENHLLISQTEHETSHQWI